MLIIMTDGESTDGDIIDYLKFLGKYVYIFIYKYMLIIMTDRESTDADIIDIQNF
jgi:hypothetical protein